MAWMMSGASLVILSTSQIHPTSSMALTDATSNTEQIRRIINDLKQRYPRTKIYILSTSRGTIDSMNLSHTLGNEISGAIHTASMSEIAAFPFDKTVMRQLFVHHKNDGCKFTNYSAPDYAAQKHGIKLITISGGVGNGDPCEAFGHHGFAGVEQETIDAIKNWIKEK